MRRKDNIKVKFVVERYQVLQRKITSVMYYEVGGSSSVRNVDIFKLNYTTSHITKGARSSVVG
jgi:hypothetical protein